MLADKLHYIWRLLLNPNSTRTMEWHMLVMLNSERRRHALQQLRMQGDLRAVARNHSTDMARKHYFEHENKSGETHVERYKAALVTDVTTGENLAMVRGYHHPTQHAHTGLMNSPGHRANILESRYNAVGIGIIQAEDSTYYFTQNFARRALLLTHVPKSARRNREITITAKVVMPVLLLCVIDINSKQTVCKLHDLKAGKTISWKIPIRGTKSARFQIMTSSDGSSWEVLNEFTVKIRRWW